MQVENVNAFGQEGGFEALITRLAPLENRPVPAAEPPPLCSQPHEDPAAAPTTSLIESQPPAGEPIGDPASSPDPSSGVVPTKSEPAGKGTGSMKKVHQEVPLEAVRQALIMVSSVRSLFTRRVVRAVVDRTATAATTALKG